MGERIPAEAFHPGEYIGDEMSARGLTIYLFCKQLGWSPVLLNAVLGERIAVSNTMAADLARVFGQDPQTWINLQAAWDAKQ